MNIKGTEEKAFIEIISSYDGIDKDYFRSRARKRAQKIPKQADSSNLRSNRCLVPTIQFCFHRDLKSMRIFHN